MSSRKAATSDRKDAMHYVVRIPVSFIINAVLFYTGWRVLTLSNLVSGGPSSGWLWLLAMRAIWSTFDKLIEDLETPQKTSRSAGFWGPYRLAMLSNVTEAAAFSTIIFHLGWLSTDDAYKYIALLTVTVILGIENAATRTAGRLRDRLWLTVISDFESGAFCGAFVPALVFASLWLNSGSPPAGTILWSCAIGICAAIGGGINLWRKSWFNI